MPERTSLPEAGFVRLKTVLSIFPVGKSTWWKGVKDGEYPQPVKLGTRAVGWRVEDIRSLIATREGGNARIS